MNKTDNKNLEKLKIFMKNEYKGEDIRFCSAYLFGNSKFIERNKPLADLFNSMAIVERPNIIYIRTDLDFFINGINIKELTEKLHLAAFFGGDVREIKHNVKTVVISENLSFFMSTKPKNAVFLYNKGFHLTNQVATFVNKIKCKRVIFFGDLDCDGLAIYFDLKKKITNVEFYPDIEISKAIISRYHDRLPDLNFKECLAKKIEENGFLELLEGSNKKIEQEFLQVLFAKGGLKKPQWIG